LLEIHADIRKCMSLRTSKYHERHQDAHALKGSADARSTEAPKPFVRETLEFLWPARMLRGWRITVRAKPLAWL
jgi:hypothetical protein